VPSEGETEDESSETELGKYISIYKPILNNWPDSEIRTT
jgi:hypothetical protein